MIKTKFKTLISLLFLIILVIGCNKPKDESEKKNDNSHIQIAYVQNNQSPSQEAKKVIFSMPEVTDVKAVNSEKEIFLAVKPKHLERFQLASLKKKIKMKIEKNNPEMKVTVSTDQKIFTLLGELESKLDKKIDTQDIDKELKKIKKKSTDEA
jgi:PBP1b-binding outer membrane lipoprotein LpoB